MTDMTFSLFSLMSARAVEIMIALNLAAVGYTAFILRRAGIGWSLVGSLSGGLIAWLVILHLIISNKALVPGDISGPAFLALVFGGVGVFGAIIRFTPVHTALISLDQDVLLLAQGIRVYFGAGFLLQAATGLLPETFGVIDGLSHITAGTVALFAASLYAANRKRVMALVGANLFGLVDILVVASSIALVLLPTMTPHHPMMYAVFLAAPIWFWLHVYALGRLLQARKLAPDTAAG